MAVKSGCMIYNGETGKSYELKTGWYKFWIYENVYGFEFIGPVSMWPAGGPYRNLAVLDHEPDRAERLEIQNRFADTLAPDGTKGMKL